MLIDVDYSHYWIGSPTDDAQFGPAGTARANDGSIAVATFTHGGPVSVRILVGDHAPGAVEDGWRGEWEHVQDLFVDARHDLEVRSWEGAEAEPPSGPFVRPGRWAVRFHARGEAKVVAEDNMPETALEEHLVLFWPDGAEPGDFPVWDEVTGASLQRSWDIGEFGALGRVKTPAGYYRLTGKAAVAELHTLGSGDVGLVQVAEDELLVASGTTKSFEVWLQGSEFAPSYDAEPLGSRWAVAAHGFLHTTRPVRLLDGTGVVPRRFADPLLPPGRWQVRLLVRSDVGEDGVIGGLPPAAWHAGARYDQRVLIWAEGSSRREDLYGY